MTNDPTIPSPAGPCRSRRSRRAPAGVGDAAGGPLGSRISASAQGLSFYEFSENVELAAKASLLPRRFGVDAIILFYDITTLTVAMGLPFTLQPDRGPVPDRPIRTLADVERLEADARSAERFATSFGCSCAGSRRSCAASCR